MANDDDAAAQVPASALWLQAPACRATLRHTTTRQAIPLADRSSNSSSSNVTKKRAMLVGRSKEADLRIQHGSISRQHAVLYYDTANSATGTGSIRLYVRDLGGKHGTTVNQTRVPTGQAVPLQAGDALFFGKVRESVFLVEWEAAVPSGGADESVAPEDADSLADVHTTHNTTVDHDQQVLVEAGEGLTGRAKRQAEIAAMMASLDQNITYTKVAEAEELPRGNESAQDAAVAALPILPKEHASLPFAGQWQIPADGEARLTCLVVDPRGARITAGRRDASVSLWDFGGMDEFRRQAFAVVKPQPEGHYPVQALAYSPTGDRVLVGSASVQPVVLDREGQFVVQFARGDMYLTDVRQTIGHTAEITAVAWHPLERSMVFTASRDGSVRRWNVDKGKRQFEKLCSDHVWLVKSTSGHKTAVTSLAVHPSGRSFAVGTSDGSVQVWTTSKTRPDKLVAAGSSAVTALSFNVNGQRLASRAANEAVVKVWKVSALSKSARPLVQCVGLPTVHDTANLAWSPDGRYLTAGASAAYQPDESKKTKERGSVNVYYIPATVPPNTMVEPCLALDTPDNAGPVIVAWHARCNQVLVGCSDGRIMVYYDPNDPREGGVWTSLGKQVRKRSADADLEDLLRARAREAGPQVTGEILTPLAQAPVKRRKAGEQKEEESLARREPQRPATGKHHEGGSASGVTTFAQFVADQTAAKSIAGRDPREALLKFKEGKSYLGKETKILDSRTMEQGDDDDAKD
jgi:WD40 repeat protein/pSer/pThr/pTyr-binding forkhead associated (FHA) protein